MCVVSLTDSFRLCFEVVECRLGWMDMKTCVPLDILAAQGWQQQQCTALPGDVAAELARFDPVTLTRHVLPCKPRCGTPHNSTEPWGCDTLEECSSWNCSFQPQLPRPVSACTRVQFWLGKRSRDPWEEEVTWVYEGATWTLPRQPGRAETPPPQL